MSCESLRLASSHCCLNLKTRLTRPRFDSIFEVKNMKHTSRIVFSIGLTLFSGYLVIYIARSLGNSYKGKMIFSFCL